MAEKDKNTIYHTEAPKDVQSQHDDSASSKHRDTCAVEGCDKRCDIYQGANPHKQDTMVCPEHGRMSVKKA